MILALFALTPVTLSEDDEGWYGFVEVCIEGKCRVVGAYNTPQSPAFPNEATCQKFTKPFAEGLANQIVADKDGHVTFRCLPHSVAEEFVKSLGNYGLPSKAPPVDKRPFNYGKNGQREA